MKRLDVNSALLCSVFSKASVFCKKNTTPILETVKVEVLKDVCILSSYDGENFILYRLPICCTEETDFSFCISMQSGFLPFLKTLGNQSISLWLSMVGTLSSATTVVVSVLSTTGALKKK